MENKYIKGLFFNTPHEKAPEFIRGNIVIKREQLIEELQKMTEETIRLDCKVSRDGKGYAQRNTWKPENKSVEEAIEDLPF